MTVGVVGIGEQRRLAQLHLGGGHVAEWRARIDGRCELTRACCPNEGAMAVGRGCVRPGPTGRVQDGPVGIGSVGGG